MIADLHGYKIREYLLLISENLNGLMEIFKDFGVDWILTAAQIINFLVIFYILKRFLYKPVFNMLKKRENAIKEGAQKAEEGKKELEKALIKEKKIIKDAQDTARNIVQDAKEQAEVLAREIDEKTKKQSDRMIEEAKIQIEQDTRKAEQQLDKYVSRLSVEFLKKSLPKVFTAKEQSEIVSQVVKELEKKSN